MEVRKACSGCRKEITSSSKRCSVCKHVFCGQECFRASWPTHRLECSENGIVRYAERLLKTSTIPCIMVSVTPDYLAPILEKDVYERFLAGTVILILRGKELTWDYP
jgi:hypothetical protein